LARCAFLGACAIQRKVRLVVVLISGGSTVMETVVYEFGCLSELFGDEVMVGDAVMVLYTNWEGKDSYHFGQTLSLDVISRGERI
jgi:hypothetical protein